MLNKTIYSLSILSLPVLICLMNSGMIISPIIFVIFLIVFAIGFKHSIIATSTKIDIVKENVSTIEAAENDSKTVIITLFLLILAGSINNIATMILVFALLFIYLVSSDTTYILNPFLLIHGYKFYYITFKSKKRVLLISKEKFTYGDEVSFELLYNINESVYIDFD